MTPSDVNTKGLEFHYSNLLDMYKNFLIFYKRNVFNIILYSKV